MSMQFYGAIHHTWLILIYRLYHQDHFGKEISNTFARVLHDPGVLLLGRVQHLNVVQTSQVRKPPGVLLEVRGHGEQRVLQRAAGVGPVPPAEILHKDKKSHKNNVPRHFTVCIFGSILNTETIIDTDLSQYPIFTVQCISYLKMSDMACTWNVTLAETVGKTGMSSFTGNPGGSFISTKSRNFWKCLNWGAIICKNRQCVKCGIANLG